MNLTEAKTKYELTHTVAGSSVKELTVGQCSCCAGLLTLHEHGAEV